MIKALTVMVEAFLLSPKTIKPPDIQVEIRHFSLCFIVQLEK